MRALERWMALGAIATAAAVAGGSGTRIAAAADERPYTTWSSYLGTPDSAQYSALNRSTSPT